MRNVLILLLVLCIAGVANASMLDFLVLNPLAEGELEAHTEYTCQIIFDDTNPDDDIGFMVAISIVGATDYDKGSLHEDFTYGVPNAGTVYDPAEGGVCIGPVEGSTEMAGPYMVDDMVVYTFTLTTGEDGTTVTFDDVQVTGEPPWGGPPIGYNTKLNGTTTINMDAVVYDVVPEPMTIALLGLGGLFLRRRK